MISLRMPKIEKETIVNYNAAESEASVYTRDPAVMKKLDRLVRKNPESYRIERESEYDRVYSMPKNLITFSAPRTVGDAKREQARQSMKQINENKKEQVNT
jgi:hypothetical protein